MERDIIYGSIIFVSLMAPFIGIVFFSFFDKYIERAQKAWLLIAIAAVASLVFQNFIEFYLVKYVSNPPLRTYVAVYGYAIRPLIIVLFIKLVRPSHRPWVAWGIVIVNALVYSTAFYSHLSVWFTPENQFMSGPLRYSAHVASFLLIIYHFVAAVLSFREEKSKILFLGSALSVVVLIGVFADMFRNSSINRHVDYVTVAAVIATCFYYFWIHIRFVTQHENDLYAQQQIQIALSQIKPHFVYNSLSAIASIEGVPEKAQTALLDFSMYLRQKLDSLTNIEVIPLQKELEVVRNYVSLEKLRFEDKVNVIFNIEYDNFSLPALTLQILVENAIKHGVTKKYEGGTVTVGSKKENGYYLLVVKDDGVGFDVKQTFSEEHLGIKNARSRLERFCNGKLKIESVIGEGTTVTVVIPESFAVEG